VDESYCKGCGLCLAFCERDVLEIAPTPNRRGVYVARVAAPEACRGCGSCALVCPEGAIRIVRP
jgi:2-oxoglutarate ferredoxin oxidoreductase subunit delta